MSKRTPHRFGSNLHLSGRQICAVKDLKPGYYIETQVKQGGPACWSRVTEIREDGPGTYTVDTTGYCESNIDGEKRVNVKTKG